MLANGSRATDETCQIFQFTRCFNEVNKPIIYFSREDISSAISRKEPLRKKKIVQRKEKRVQNQRIQIGLDYFWRKNKVHCFFSHFDFILIFKEVQQKNQQNMDLARKR